MYQVLPTPLKMNCLNYVLADCQLEGWGIVSQKKPTTLTKR